MDREQNSYSDFVNRLFVNRSVGADGLMHAAVGIAGEAGELLDAMKKHWVYNKPLDLSNIIEELGDLEWYMQAMRNLIGVPREHILCVNMDKLNKRFPQGYTDAAAQERADKAETE